MVNFWARNVPRSRHPYSGIPVEAAQVGCYDELAALLKESSDCANFMIDGAEVIVHRITKSTSWLSPSAKIVGVAIGYWR